MSLFSSLLVTAGGALEDIMLRTQRSIGTIVPGVVIEEDHTDELAITQHPVETGADVTDHAFKQPSQVTMRCGWSQSGSNTPGAGFLSPSPKEVYQMLQDLQNSREPIDVITGKRKYKNMLVKRLSMTTDVETENCLIIDVDLQEVILVDTSTSTATTGSIGTVASQAANGSLVNAGVQQLSDVTAQSTVAQVQAMEGMYP